MFSVIIDDNEILRKIGENSLKICIPSPLDIYMVRISTEINYKGSLSIIHQLKIITY